MPFNRKRSIRPVSILGISMIVGDPDPTDPDAVQSARVEIGVAMDNGRMEIVQEDLANHLTAIQITQLRTIMASIRTKANAEILPVT